jgi:hypothetical protein
MTITEILKIQFSIHFACMHIKLNFTAYAKAVLKCGVYCSASWTVPACSRMLADEQDQLLTQFCGVLEVHSVKESQILKQTVQKITF